MVCDRCGEMTETFMTEQYGEICEACQHEIEQLDQGRDLLQDRPAPGQDG